MGPRFSNELKHVHPVSSPSIHRARQDGNQAGKSKTVNLGRCLRYRASPGCAVVLHTFALAAIPTSPRQILPLTIFRNVLCSFGTKLRLRSVGGVFVFAPIT